MGMKAVFECDDCGVKAALRGNITMARSTMEAKGWLTGKLVLCPGCAQKMATSVDSPSPVAAASPVEVCSDGSTVGSNPGHGAWGWADSLGVVQSGEADQHPTTNQRMEILAAVKALEAHPRGPVLLFTDSKYVEDCVNKRWYKGWERRGWKTAGGTPVKHKDLWQRLVTALEANGQVTVQWVKGHQNHELNVRADEAANSTARAAMVRRKGEGQ